MAVLTGFIALGLGACSSDDNGGGGGGGGTSSFVGTVVGGAANNESGSLTFDIAGTALAPPASITTMSSASLTVTGTLTLVSPAAGTQTLTGTYDDATNHLDLSGGGYTFTGVFDGTSRLEGTYNGANGAGLFVAALDLGNAVAFCGTFDGDDDGTRNFVVNGTVLSGSALTSSGDVAPLDGTVTGGAVSIVNPLDPQGPPLATGTITGPSATGIWDDGQGSSGTWTGNGC
ncbi:MAG TPA: hypothetical protein VLA89_15770 [Gemmatimonadales bacterium]|nr:hypothetical protein [Gemmatimonadales bacterium]